MTSILLFGTIFVLFTYYTRIKHLRLEYGKAKRIVDDIIFGLNKQLKRQKKSLLFIGEKVENIILNQKNFINKLENYEDQLSNFSNLTNNIKPLDEKFLKELERIEYEVKNLKESQNKTLERLIQYEKKEEKSSVSNIKIDSAIPIEREKALEPLTKTEFKVLNLIGRDGEKTSSEIRNLIYLTREHTARLMKKLYKDGYLERDTHKMPYIYRLKEEMTKILNKNEL